MTNEEWKTKLHEEKSYGEWQSQFKYASSYGLPLVIKMKSGVSLYACCGESHALVGGEEVPSSIRFTTFSKYAEYITVALDEIESIGYLGIVSVIRLLRQKDTIINDLLEQVKKKKDYIWEREELARKIAQMKNEIVYFENLLGVR